MDAIGIDMFEVQLGASLLLQFSTDQGVVRVLADAGVKASGYPVGHVHDKLPEAFRAFGDPDPRIDLMIGTHYDEDHLVGLVPIAADESIPIGEAWLPPVADDTAHPRSPRGVASDDLLVTRFAGPDRAARLDAYLRAKQEVCVSAGVVERAADRLRPDRPRTARPDLDLGTRPRARPTASTDWAATFRAHADDAAITLGHEDADQTHADVLYGTAAPSGPPADSRSPAQWRQHWTREPAQAGTDARAFATIRRAAARDAINAIALADLVAALVARGVPIRSPMIADGQPVRLVWSAAQRRFLPTPGSPATALEATGQLTGHANVNLPAPPPPNPSTAKEIAVTLLGPSAGLVASHWQRLPVGEYVARSRAASIPILSITPSNQLSLVTRFEAAGQGILVCGDAGFVDFAPRGGDYFPALLAGLLPAQVVQVAHHAGNNAHFYAAMLAAGYADQSGPSLLLVSHATRDKYRPSAAFAQFIAELRPAPDGPRALFTSKPKAERAAPIRAAVHPVVGESHTVGDVRLAFDGSAWVVKRHSIAV